MALLGIDTFGEYLRYLRKRIPLTQEELGRRVGYDKAHISNLERNERKPPDLPTLLARFVPALDLEDSPEDVAQLMDFAATVRGEKLESLQKEAITQRDETVQRDNPIPNATDVKPLPASNNTTTDVESASTNTRYRQSSWAISRNYLIAVAMILIAIVAAVFYFAAGGQTVTNFEIAADQEWQDTKVFLSKGDVVTVTYVSGMWTVAKNDTNAWGYIDAGGYKGTVNSPYVVGTKYGELLGRVGVGVPFGIGDTKTFVPDTSGYLSFRINDEGISDNGGSVSVRIVVQK